MDNVNLNILRENIKGQKEPSKVFYKKGVLKNFAKFTVKHLAGFSFLIKRNFIKLY